MGRSAEGGGRCGPRRLRFPRGRRLTRRSDFRRVFAAKRVFIDGELIVHAAANGGRPTRLGMAIGRQVGGAVRRNRIKRLIREAFRLNQHRLPEGLDLVVVTRKGAQLTLEAMSASLCALAARAAAVAHPPRGCASSGPPRPTSRRGP